MNNLGKTLGEKILEAQIREAKLDRRLRRLVVVAILFVIAAAIKYIAS